MKPFASATTRLMQNVSATHSTQENTVQDLLAELLSRCDYGVYVLVNEHRPYINVKRRINEYSHFAKPPEISDSVREEIIRTDTIVDLRFYSDHPERIHHIVHYDLQQALREALDCLDNLSQ